MLAHKPAINELQISVFSREENFFYVYRCTVHLYYGTCSGVPALWDGSFESLGQEPGDLNMQRHTQIERRTDSNAGTGVILEPKMHTLLCSRADYIGSP